MTPARFRKIVWTHYKKHGRHDLPWRPPTLKLRRDKTLDPYRVLVSEVMLQQTQVERVIPFYTKFIKRFPTAGRLASTPLSSVLQMWQGLGYNRRAKMLREAAKQLISTPLSGTRLNLVKKLEELPGVGPYTARAVAAFAWNQDGVFVETNIRTAIIHHFFAGKRERGSMIYHTSARKHTDAEIEKILKWVLPKGKAREWYSALMDYGAHLKRSGISYNAKSKKYAKQSKFTGSLREARGIILRALSSRRRYQGEALMNILGAKRRAQVRKALTALQAEKLVKRKGRNFMLAD